MGSIYVRHQSLWVKMRDGDGKIVRKPTGYKVGQEHDAKRLLARLERRAEEGRRVGAELGPMTVARYADGWLKKRDGIVRSIHDDRARLRDHVLSVFGDMPIAEVALSAVADHLLSLRKRFAARTVRNIHAVMRTMFDDAVREGFCLSNPCLVRKGILPPIVDKDPTWRAGAVFSRDELAVMIQHPALLPDRRLVYALKGLAGLRHGEVAGLRWSAWKRDEEPLTMLVVAASYGGRTKTMEPRRVPVHPVLAAMLDEWRERGWVETYRKRMEPDGLIVPTRRMGMRQSPEAQAQFLADLERMGLRGRRGHDLRRTMISLAVVDGARMDVLERVTHAAPTAKARDLYLTVPWASSCAEVAKIHVPGLDVAVAALAALGTGPGTGARTQRETSGKIATPAGFESFQEVATGADASGQDATFSVGDDVLAGELARRIG